MKITWYGTASISITTERGAILFDPFIPLNGSNVNIDGSSYARFDSIVVTHAHLDHIASLPELCAESPRKIFGTKAVEDALLALDVPRGSIHRIAPGSKLRFGDITVTAYRSRHIQYDKKTVLHTFVNVRMLRYARNLSCMARTNKICQEHNETVGYLIESGKKRVFLLGSMNLDPDATYPQHADLLILPYQGTSNLLAAGLAIINRLTPKAVLLDHFDDTFPPLSDTIHTTDIESALKGRLPVYKPEYGLSVEV